MGATVFLPFGHSPDVDVVACTHGRLLRIQVKTSTQRTMTPDGHERRPVALATKGGNRSWNGTAKKIDPANFDYLYAHTGDGRRWFVPSTALEVESRITLGGPKYSEFEIEPGRPIDRMVYDESSRLESRTALGEYPSGQRMATVNRPAQPSQVRILPPPFQPRSGFERTKYERKAGQSNQARINQKRRVTLPQQPCIEAGLQDDDLLLVRSGGDGVVILERVNPPPSAVASSE
jgi:hypothetical protein